MKFFKQLTITLAAAVLAVGAVTIAPQQAEASPGYYYTDSRRPPVLTPTGNVHPDFAKSTNVVSAKPKQEEPKATTPVVANESNDKTVVDQIIEKLVQLIGRDADFWKTLLDIK